jgi:NAD(P)-dependent dehydrogenase (short-subunit alcohol dehydrogenase family)
METLKKSKVLIAGGSSGIGATLAKMLVAEGAEVVVFGRDPGKLEKLRMDLPAVHTQAVDARDRPSLDAQLQTVGKIDHLVLTLSGGKGGGLFRDLVLGDLREGFEGKFWPQLNLLQAALPHMNMGGSVTLVSATSAGLSMPGTSGLAAINGALDMMVPILASELKPMRVNAVSPGMIDTPWWDFLPEESKKQVFQDFSTKVYVGRIGRAEEVADTIHFILRNGYINGTIIRCDGGLS